MRNVVQDDWAYILDSFKKSFRDLGSEQHVPAYVWYRGISERIDSLRKNDKVEFRIACDPEESNFIWGWAIVEAGSIVHYIFVRASAQGQGVATMLLKDVPRPVVCTHWTKAAETFQKKHPGLLMYEPSRRKK